MFTRNALNSVQTYRVSLTGHHQDGSAMRRTPRHFPMFERYQNVDASLLIRSDFSNDAAWAELCDSVLRPSEDGYRACFVCVNDPRLSGIAPKSLANQVYQDLGHSAVFVADSHALKDSEHPVLCMAAGNRPGASFRVIPKEIWGPENNLRLANMDFADFANAADVHGVFRGFRL